MTDLLHEAHRSHYIPICERCQNADAVISTADGEYCPKCYKQIRAPRDAVLAYIRITNPCKPEPCRQVRPVTKPSGSKHILSDAEIAFFDAMYHEEDEAWRDNCDHFHRRGIG